MKTIVSSDLTAKIRFALSKKCKDRRLDNEEDFIAVMSVIKTVVDKWMKNRCQNDSQNPGKSVQKSILG